MTGGLFGPLRAWWAGPPPAEAREQHPAHSGAAAPLVYGKPPLLASLRRGDGPRRVAVFLDESREAEFAFKWAAENLIDKPHDRCAACMHVTLLRR